MSHHRPSVKTILILAANPTSTSRLQQFTPQLLSSMNREELVAVIERPAQKLIVQLEAQLTQRILDDVGQEPGNLPLLEFALTRLWKKQENRVLTHACYNEIGGVKKALANHAEYIYSQLSEQEQNLAQRIFLQLVRPGEGTEDTRRIATRAEVGEQNWGLVTYLAGYQARLVVTGRNEQSGEETVEVVHEALIRNWGELQQWIAVNRDFRAWQERLRAAMLQWEETKRDEGALLQGAALANAFEKFKERREELSQAEQDFIQQGIKRREKLKKELEEQQKRELEAARQLAQASEARRKAEEEARQQAEKRAEQEAKALADREHLLQLETLARTEAEKAKRDRDEFFVVLSHELRTPITTIVGWSRLLLAEKHRLSNVQSTRDARKY